MNQQLSNRRSWSVIPMLGAVLAFGLVRLREKIGPRGLCLGR